MAGFELFEGGQGCIEYDEETIYATQHETTKKGQLEKHFCGGGVPELEILLHKDVFGL
jgi:hypothetical protein